MASPRDRPEVNGHYCITGSGGESLDFRTSEIKKKNSAIRTATVQNQVVLVSRALLLVLRTASFAVPRTYGGVGRNGASSELHRSSGGQKAPASG